MTTQPSGKEQMATNEANVREHVNVLRELRIGVGMDIAYDPLGEAKLKAIDAAITALCTPPPPPATKGWDNRELVSELRKVLEIAPNASTGAPMRWAAHRGMTPEKSTELLAHVVRETVKDGHFSGEMHLIEESDSGRAIAYTGCGLKSGHNAQFLVACAHFVLRFGDTLPLLSATQPNPEARESKLRDYIAYLRGDEDRRYADATNAAVQSERLRIADELEKL